MILLLIYHIIFCFYLIICVFLNINIKRIDIMIESGIIKLLGKLAHMCTRLAYKTVNLEVSGSSPE